MLEKKHRVCDLESTETIKCSATVESQSSLRKSISWYNGSTGVEIKSGRRIKLNGLFLKINNVQLDDAGTYECRTRSSSRFYTIYVNSEYSLYSFFRLVSSVLIWLHLTLTLTSPLIFKQ